METEAEKEKYKVMTPPAMVFLNEEENAYYFSRGGGPFLISWQQAKNLIRGLTKYYNTHSEEGIEKLNDEMDKEIYEHIKHKSPPTEPLPIEGYIYLLLADNGLVKIGKTVNLEDRIEQIRPKLPYKTEVIRIFKVKDYTKAEKLFHEYYDSKRLNQSEWFMLTEKDWEEYWDNSFPKQIKDLIMEE